MEESNIKTHQHPLIIRQSVVHFCLRIIILQVLLAITYILIHFMISNISTSQKTGFLFFSYDIWTYIIIAIAQICFTLQILLQWLNYYFELRPAEIAFRTGFLDRKEKIYSLTYIESITINQHMLGRILNYGTINLYNPVLKKSIYINSINNPQKYMKLIEEEIAKARKAENHASILFAS